MTEIHKRRLNRASFDWSHVASTKLFVLREYETWYFKAAVWKSIQDILEQSALDDIWTKEE
jgi:hypothetical protein